MTEPEARDDRPRDGQLESADDLFGSLAAELRNGRSAQEIYDAVVSYAPRLVDGCDRAAIGILDGDRFTGVASTDDVVRYIDELQSKLHEGPCLESSADEKVHQEPDLTTSTKWPRLAARVVADTPVRSALAVPLVHEGRRSGALDLFADRPGAFGPDSIGQAAVLASFASVALAAANRARLADQLSEGLTTNREIGAAVGILMATHGISQGDAFDLLSQASQRLNRKLRDIAAGIVRGEGGPTQ